MLVYAGIWQRESIGVIAVYIKYFIVAWMSSVMVPLIP